MVGLVYRTPQAPRELVRTGSRGLQTGEPLVFTGGRGLQGESPTGFSRTAEIAREVVNGVRTDSCHCKGGRQRHSDGGARGQGRSSTVFGRGTRGQGRASTVFGRRGERAGEGGNGVREECERTGRSSTVFGRNSRRQERVSTVFERGENSHSLSTQGDALGYPDETLTA